MCRRGRLFVECLNFLKGFYFKAPNDPSRITFAPVSCYVMAKYKFMLIRINTNCILLAEKRWEDPGSVKSDRCLVAR